jgi:hypothetical protein
VSAPPIAAADVRADDAADPAFYIAGEVDPEAPQALDRTTALVVGQGDAQSITAMRVLFKRAQGGVYGAPQWLDPPFKSGLVGGPPSVDARAEGAAAGIPIQIASSWLAADPELLELTPVAGELDHVRITATRVGQTTLTITAGGVSTTLQVNATRWSSEAMQLEISESGPTVAAGALE